MEPLNEFYSARSEMGRPDVAARDRIRKSVAIIESLRPRVVLDVGCGDGSTAAHIRQRTGATVVAVDASDILVEAAREKGIEASICQIGVEPLPQADASVDVVYMAEVLEHLVDPDRALVEIGRVLTSDGHLVLSTPNLACLLNRFVLPLGLQPFFTEVSTRAVIGRRYAAFGEHSPAVGHLRIATLPALRKLLALNGFTVERVVGATFLKTPTFRAIESLVCRRPSLASIVVVHARKQH